MSNFSISNTAPSATDTPFNQRAKLLTEFLRGVKVIDGSGHAAKVDADGHLLVLSTPFEFDISDTNLYLERPARVFKVFGWRAGFTSTSVLNDVTNFLPNQAGGAAAVATSLDGTESLELVSSSSDDDGSPVGTGVGRVRITYMDLNGDMKITDEYVLDGTSSVAVAEKMLFVYWMEATGSGDGSVAAGNIDLRATVGGIIYSRIDAASNRSGGCEFRVPSGYTAFVRAWDGSARGTADQKLFLRAQSHTFDDAPDKRGVPLSRHGYCELGNGHFPSSSFHQGGGDGPGEG